MRRDKREKPGPKARTTDEELKEILDRKERFKNVGRKRKVKGVGPDELEVPCVEDQPAEKRESCAVRKMPKTIRADKETGKKILKALQESLAENPELPRYATSHFSNILTKMGYKKRRHNAENRLPQLNRAHTQKRYGIQKSV